MIEMEWAKRYMERRLPQVPDWAAAEGMKYSMPQSQLWLFGRFSPFRYGHKSSGK